MTFLKFNVRSSGKGLRFYIWLFSTAKAVYHLPAEAESFKGQIVYHSYVVCLPSIWYWRECVRLDTGMVGAGFDACSMQLFASGATARNAFGARILIILFLVLCLFASLSGQKS